MYVIKKSIVDRQNLPKVNKDVRRLLGKLLT